ncbi:Competence protein ComM [subsurface metagenome]
MPLAKIMSAAVVGLDAQPVEVETDISAGLPAFNIVGLPDKAVEEAKERVRAAIKNSKAKMADRRITVNLAPADLPKVGPAYDLPIAVGILKATQQIEPGPEDLKNSLFLGELSLDGTLRHINGTLPLMLMAKKQSIENIFLPKINLKEAELIEDLKLHPVESLKELIGHFKGESQITPQISTGKLESEDFDTYDYDMAFIKGQEHVKRALEIAAAGAHNVLMSGPPGAGKTLLARTMPSVMPKMLKDEVLEVTKIYSVSGLLPKDMPLISERPFRSPHHTASDIALVGGGQIPRPGEVTLAHKGVLFLDEFAEFGRAVLESLRQPIEDRIITISRAAGVLRFPAHFTLVAAMNPCPCGYLGDPKKQCICTPAQVIKYQKKVSGPLIDRIDLHIEVPQVKYEKLTSEKVSEESAKIRGRVEKARGRQEKRFANHKISTNSEMRVQDMKKYCKVDEKSKDLLKTAVNQLNLSARAYHRILKLARTIADLEGIKEIKPEHIAEAIQYRPKEQQVY